MVKGIVKIRFRRYFEKQPLWVFIGKVLEATDNWIKVDGRGIVIMAGIYTKTYPVDIDSENRVLVIPRDNIAHIRIMPDDFDITNMKVNRTGFRYYVNVKNGPDASLGELGELI